MIILVIGRIEVRNHQKRAFLKQDDFIGANGRAEPLQAELAKAMAEATEFRTKEHATNSDTIADAQAGVRPRNVTC